MQGRGVRCEKREKATKMMESTAMTHQRPPPMCAFLRTISAQPRYHRISDVVLVRLSRSPRAKASTAGHSLNAAPCRGVWSASSASTVSNRRSSNGSQRHIDPAVRMPSTAMTLTSTLSPAESSFGASHANERPRWTTMPQSSPRLSSTYTMVSIIGWQYLEKNERPPWTLALSSSASASLRGDTASFFANASASC